MNTVYIGTLGSGPPRATLSPVVQGSTDALHTISVEYADDSTVYDLTGKTVTGLWWRNNDPSTVYAITGTLSVTSAANGIFTWDKSAADVGTPGTLQVQFVFAEAGEDDAAFPATMTVEARGDANAVAGSALVGIATDEASWLSDVHDSIGGVTGTSEDNVLTFDANGIPQDSGIDIAALGGGSADLDSLTDVTITTPADNALLAFDSGSGDWINQTAAEAGLATANHTHTESDVTDLGDYQPEDAAIVAVSSTHTLQAGNAGKVHECDGTFTVTLPDGLDTGYQVSLINVGSGTITIAAATTLQSADSAVTMATQYKGCVVYHRGSNVWLAMGGLE